MTTYAHPSQELDQLRKLRDRALEYLVMNPDSPDLGMSISAFVCSVGGAVYALTEVAIWNADAAARVLPGVLKHFQESLKRILEDGDGA